MIKNNYDPSHHFPNVCHDVDHYHVFFLNDISIWSCVFYLFSVFVYACLDPAIIWNNWHLRPTRHLPPYTTLRFRFACLKYGTSSHVVCRWSSFQSCNNSCCCRKWRKISKNVSEEFLLRIFSQVVVGSISRHLSRRPRSKWRQFRGWIVVFNCFFLSATWKRFDDFVAQDFQTAYFLAGIRSVPWLFWVVVDGLRNHFWDWNGYVGGEFQHSFDTSFDDDFLANVLCFALRTHQLTKK